jgi:hypothetical protein
MEATSSDVITQTHPVTPPAALSLNSVAGSVQVRADQISEIRVRATKRGSERARESTTIEQRAEGNRVTVRTVGGGESGLAGLLGMVGGTMAPVDYEITVPIECEVQIKTVSAGVDLRGTRGRARIETVSGEIRVTGVTGECNLHSISGYIEADALEGSLTVHATSGEARVTRSTLHDFNLETVSGDLEVETPLLPNQRYFARTVSGDLRLAVPEGTGATVVMKSISGEVRSDLPAQVIKSGRRHWQGLINGGGAHVEMNSVSGDMRVVRGAGTVPSPPPVPEAAAPPPDAPAHADAAAILSLLEQGEIEVDEALRRLEALRS